MMSASSNRTEPAIQEAAFAWLAELNGGGISSDRLVSFRAWKEADSAHAAAFAKAEALWRDLDWSEALNAEALETSSAPALTARRERPCSRSTGPTRRVRWVRVGAALAACLAVAVLAGPGFRLLTDMLQVQTLEATTEPGSVRHITLADGSQVTLGGRSSVKIRMSRDRRQVELIDGDAYFEVAPDAARPFVVEAGELTATAVGTAFEVNRGSRRAQVGVTHGRVRAEIPGEEVMLDPGERARLVAGRGGLAVETFDPTKAGRWREQRAAFRNIPLGQVVEDLNRYHPAGVVLADPTLADLPISAAFRLDQMEVALNGMALSYDLVVRRDAQGRVVLDRRRPARR